MNSMFRITLYSPECRIPYNMTGSSVTASLRVHVKIFCHNHGLVSAGKLTATLSMQQQRYISLYLVITTHNNIIANEW